jgi:hypothetical protein
MLYVINYEQKSCTSIELSRFSVKVGSRMCVFLFLQLYIYVTGVEYENEINQVKGKQAR